MSRGGVRPGAGRPKSEPTKMMRIPVGAEQLVKHLISVYRNLSQDDINDILRRACRFPELESEAVLLQLGDFGQFAHNRQLKQHLQNSHGVIVLRSEEQTELFPD